MARQRLQGRPRKGTKNVTLSLTNPLAQRIHYELSNKEIASSRYQALLLKSFSEETPWQEQARALHEELKLANQMQEIEIEQVRAKYAVYRDYLDKLKLLLTERVRDKQLAEAENEIQQLKAQVKE